ncbi:HEAT repeat domain-containing protein [Streptomyces sp. NPDC059166]|uniref:HEAT repeat domain-containing protein n=1 Tax=Streptomyces sp. NPDC059166 TaxID=3346752 RepID=UPI00368BC1F1
MFTGIDEVDWASMRHAYGPADDVPVLLRGLASADPAERENALDGMYGAVHHQGDVYACTLASIPFLFELAVDPAIPDRGGVIELLTSIGGIELDEDEEDGLDDLDAEEIEGVANYAMAAAAVSAGSPVFFELVADEDPGVRLAAPLALATLHPAPGRVLTLLRERLPVESDGEVRRALVEAAGRIALRHRSLAPGAADWLSRLASEAYPPGLRLAALAQLARCAPDALPGDVVPVVSGLLRDLRSGPGRPARTGGVPAGGDGAGSGGLTGLLRELSAGESAGRSAPWTADLLRTLHAGLGDRVADRTALLKDQLGSPDPGQRLDAVRMSGGLIGGWRGSYEELVRLVGTQLSDPEPRLAEAAAYTLDGLCALAVPAGDALARRVAADPGAWVREWASGPPGLDPAVKALAKAGDIRALPALEAALDRPEVPGDVGFVIGFLGDAAAPLAGPLRRRLGEVGLDEDAYDRASPLLAGLTALRAGEAAPEVLRVLREAPEYRGEWLRTAALRALGSFGPAARCAVPELRRLAGRPGTSSAAEAAEALWAVTGDADAVLPALAEGLRAEQARDCRTAASALGALGPRAAVVAPRLRALLSHGELWLRVDAAIALWEITGRAAEVVPVLLSAWEENCHVRIRVAECLARMGPGGAGSEATRVLRAELLSVRRHTASDGGFGAGHNAHGDERLLALCRRALQEDTGKGTTS